MAAKSSGDTTHGESIVSKVSGAGSWVLVAVAGGDLRAFPLAENVDLTIGRDAECDIVLDHHRVSRRHARIRVTGDACVVEDLGSRNGTRLSETMAPNTPRPVRPGDAIGIGPFTLVAVREPSQQPTSSLVIEDPLGESPSPVLLSVARSGASVLIRGETGSGKQVLSETLHRLSGRDGKLVSINCAAIGSELLESELFGHERGAFTGAVASKPGLLEVAGPGTVLLDEIGDMPMALQAKLLRAVESREIMRVGGTQPIQIHARFLSATHRDLLAACESGNFRLDLYYRLAGVTLTIPPLRERRGSVVPTARELLAAAAQRDSRTAPKLSAGASAKLQAYDWPGNVRELRNVIDRALILAHEVIEADQIVFDMPSRPATIPPPTQPASSISSSSPGTLPPADLSAAEAEERKKILDALEQCSGNQTRAAKVLGISRSTLATKLSILRIPRPRK